MEGQKKQHRKRGKRRERKEHDSKRKKRKRKKKKKKKRKNDKKEEKEEEYGYWRAVKRGRLNELRKVLKDEQELNWTDTYDRHGWQGIHYAAYRGDGDMVDLLISYGANVNISTQSTEKATSLHLALLNEHAETVCRLVEHGANPLLPNNDGITGHDLGVERVLERAYHLRDMVELQTLLREEEEEKKKEKDKEEGYGMFDDEEWARKLAEEWGWDDTLQYRDAQEYEDLNREATSTQFHHSPHFHMNEDEYASYIEKEMGKRTTRRHYSTQPPHEKGEGRYKKEEGRNTTRTKEQGDGMPWEHGETPTQQHIKATEKEKKEAEKIRYGVEWRKQWNAFKQGLLDEKEGTVGGPRRMVNEEDFPFPNLDDPFSLADLHVLDPTLSKKDKMRGVMSLYMEFHPDKFMGRYGSMMHPDDLSSVLKKVTQVAQHVSHLKDLINEHHS